MLAILALIKKDLVLSFRHPMSVLNPIIFFILITLLFPLAVTSSPQQLQQIGPGIIWIAVLFSNMLTMENLFGPDYEDGTLEQMALNSTSFTGLIFVRIAVHWCLTILPLLAVTFLVGKLFFISNHAISVIILSLLLGSPVLTFIGAIGGALTIGLANRGLLLVLLLLPLYVPVLIFGAGAANDALQNLPVTSQLAFLGAFLALSVTFAPWAVSAALRISLE